MNKTNAKSYVEDVVIHSENEESRTKYLENVYQLLLKYGLRIQLMKGLFMQSGLKFLGYRIHKQGSILMKEKYRLYVMRAHQVSGVNRHTSLE